MTPLSDGAAVTEDVVDGVVPYPVGVASGLCGHIGHQEIRDVDLVVQPTHWQS